MAIISQFDTDTLLINIKEKHHAWHTAGGAHGHPGRTFAMGSAGSGHEFLQFHKDLMNDFFNWNNLHNAASAADIAAWTGIPAELKLSETGWPNPGFGTDLAVAEARINSNSPPFATDDALGIHIETTIHNWIHGAVAASSILALPAAEKTIIAGFHSVQSTFFYKIHGLVQYWWDRWLHPKTHIKEIIDHKVHIKDILDVHKPIIIDTGLGKLQVRDIIDPRKMARDTIDPFRRIEDPMIKTVLDRIAELEVKANTKRSPFIKPFMRPMVGETIAKKGGKRK